MEIPKYLPFLARVPYPFGSAIWTSEEWNVSCLTDSCG
jgi:hypothetical protein